MISEALIIALVSGLTTGAVTWGAMRVEIRFLRRDVDRAHIRLDSLPCSGFSRRQSDRPPCQPED